MDGFKRPGATLLTLTLMLSALPSTPALASSPSIQRIKGTIGFEGSPGGKQTDVTTGSDIPAGSVAFSNCSSLAVVYLPDGAQVTLGGKTSFATPATDGTPAMLRFGAVHYDLTGRPNAPLTIATSFGTVAIAHGSGYVVTGESGTEAIDTDGGPSDVTFTANNVSSPVPGGQSVVVTASGKPAIAPLTTVNNPAIYQFNDGRNPLGTDRTALFQDPASSPQSECNGGGVAAAGAGGGALALLGLGAAGAIAVAVGHGSGGGGGGGSTTPTGGDTPTPIATAAGTPTPVATSTATTSGGATPTPTASAGTSSVYGPVVLNPSSILLSPGVGSPAESTFTATQSGYSGPFTVGQPTCPVNLLGAPSALSSGNTITIGLPAQVAAVSLLCSVTVTGAGGMSATEPLDIAVVAVGSASPTPTPAPGAPGAITANPASVLLNPGIGSAASQTIAVTQPNYTGPFTATLQGCIGLGAPPTISVSGSNVVVSLPAQGVAADVGCSATIYGGGGMSVTVPVTINVAAVGTPTAAPTSSGSAGAGPHSASPSTILLDPSAVTPATQNIIVTPGAEGPFTATTSCSVPIGAEPLTSTTGNVVTVTAPAQVLTAPIGCSTVVISTVTGNSVTIPILISATAVGPASPTPSPNPTGNGPLFTVPNSILVNPGLTTDATQNIEIYDHGFTGTYAVSIAPGCLSLQAPGVKLVNGNIAAVTVPGQLLNVALLCDVTVSDGTQTVEVPLTISATILSGFKVVPRFDGIVFRPATLAIDREGAQAAFDVIGRYAPYRATSACPGGTTLETDVTGSHAIVRAANVARDSTCMVTITGAGGSFGQIPVRVTAGGLGTRTTLQPGRGEAIPQSSAVSLGLGEERSVGLGGAAPFALASSCARIADTRLDGSMLHVAARGPGSCSVTVRSAAGVETNVSVLVRRAARQRMDAKP